MVVVVVCRAYVIGAILACPALARADELATSPARPDYQASERLLMWPGRARLEQRGFVIDGTYATEAFFAPQLDHKLTAGGLFTFELDADLGALASSKLGAVHVSAFAIHGDTITNELMDIHGTSGNAAAPDVRVFEAWLEQPLGRLTLRAGLVAADQEFVLADRSGTLLSATFGITSQFSANLIGPVYPVATPGVSARLELPMVVARSAIYDGTQMNAHGFPTAFGPDYLVISEVELAETFTLGGWHHPERGDAVYAVADAQLAPQLGGFARVGIAEGPVTAYIDAGLRASPAWRSDDFISVGLAFARTEQGAHTTVEATYEAQLRWLTLQPDVQLVMLPERTVVCVATRMTVAF